MVRRAARDSLSVILYLWRDLRNNILDGFVKLFTMFLIIVFIIITNNYYEVFQKVIGVSLNVFGMQMLFCKLLFKIVQYNKSTKILVCKL